MGQKKSLITIIVSSMILLLALDLILQLSISINNVKNQSSLIIDQIEEVLIHNEKELAELNEATKIENIIRAKAASYIIEHDSSTETDLEELKKIANLLQVDEIHLFDTTGTIYGGTHPKYYNYSFDSGEQMAFFKPMLTDRTLSLCQDLTPNTAESKMMMYALVWREDGAGMVQIGMEPVRLLENQRQNELSHLFANMPSSYGDIMFVVDRASETVLGSTKESFTDMTLEELGIELSESDSKEIACFSNVDNESYYCMLQEYNGYYIVVLHQTLTVFANIPTSMLILFFFLTFVSIVMILAVSYYTEKEQKQQKALLLALEKAETASKSKSNFLFNMSHDIRTPMNAILGLTKIARDNIDNRQKVLNSLEDVNNAGKHLERLINNILDMAQIENNNIELNPQPYHLPTTLGSIGPLFAMEAQKKNITFTVNWDIKDEIVFYDRPRMEQVELNLLGNAIKYTPDGGTVTYTLTQIGEAENGYAVYEGVIKDTGIGMSEEFLEHLFDLFARERNSTTTGIQGIGLGLSITKKILEAMGGTITCESEQGAGSTFTFRVSLKVGEEKDLPQEAKAFEEHHDLTGKRLLLAEDIEINREIVIELLSEYGVLIEVAEDGQIAVDKVSRATPGYYGLILMDIQMPNMDGYTATKTIRCLKDPGKANIPIIALTANALEEDRKNAFAAGMNDHIAKPIDLQILVAALEKYFGT